MTTYFQHCLFSFVFLVFISLNLEAQTNIALKKPARQSTTAFGGKASRAVDGNTDGQWGNNSVTHTSDERSAWWEVDLGDVYEIDRIIIWNRQDCCWERLQNFFILTSEKPIIKNASGGATGDGFLKGPFFPWSADKKSFTFKVDENTPEKKARYIRIILRQDGPDRPLSLAEVQVFGTLAPERENAKGEALFFNSKGYAQFNAPTNMPSVAAKRTIEFWVKAELRDNANQQPSPIVELGDYSNDASAFGIFIAAEAGRNYFYLRRNKGEKLKLMEVPDDQWNFIAIVFDGSLLSGYINGFPKFSKHLTQHFGGKTLNTKTGIVYIGGNPNLQQYFSGALGDITIWNGARSANQIKDDMLPFPCITGNELNLVVHFSLDEGAGNTFKSTGGAISGVLKNGVTWTKPIAENPTPLAEGIWYVIQNKSDVMQDLDIPAKNLALKTDGNIVHMETIPYWGNYDAFLWRVVKLSDGGFKLINKKLGANKALDSAPTNPTIGNNSNVSGQLWFLEQTNVTNFGTNAISMSNGVISKNKAIYLNNGNINVTNKNTGDTRQVWLFQPMELSPGYHIPTEPENCPSTKILLTDSGLKAVGTNTVSDWAMLNMHLVVDNMIKALEVPMRRLNKSILYMISPYDNDGSKITQYPMMAENATAESIRDYAGGQHGDFTLVNEALTCHLYADGSYREFDHITHEFGHAIHNYCDQDMTKVPVCVLKNAAECYAGSVQAWFNSNYSYFSMSRTRKQLNLKQKGLYNFMNIVFNQNNSWIPPRDLRSAVPISFGSSVTSGTVFLPEKTMLTGSFVGTKGQKMECKLAQDGNLFVHSKTGVGHNTPYNAIHHNKIKGGAEKLEFINGTLIFKKQNGEEIDRMGVYAPNSNLALAEDNNTKEGVLKVVSEFGSILWASGNPDDKGNTIASGTEFNAGEVLTNGTLVSSLVLTFQEDGNLTISDKNGGAPKWGGWGSYNHLKVPLHSKKLRFKDGELIFLSPDGKEVDRIGYYAPNARLALIEDELTGAGSLNVISQSGHILWKADKLRASSNAVSSGQTFNAGQILAYGSQAGNLVLTFQEDGNLTISDKNGGAPKWGGWGSYNHLQVPLRGKKLKFQDGELIFLDPAGQKIGLLGGYSPNARLVLVENMETGVGTLKIFDEDGNIFWEADKSPKIIKNTIESGAIFKPNQDILKGSKNINLKVKMGEDGNFMLLVEHGNFLWGSINNADVPSWMKEIKFVDGELIFYDERGQEKRRIGKKSAGARFVLVEKTNINDSYIQIVAADGTVLWKSK